MQKLLLTTDFSDLARTAYPVAASLAAGYGAEVHLVHVEELSGAFHLEEMGLNDLRKHYRQHCLPLLNVEANHPALMHLQVRTDMLAGPDPCDALTRFAEEQRMDSIIMATHGRTGLAHALMGSFAEKVVRYSSVPVLTCHAKEGAAETWIPRSVLVPYDFSKNAGAVFSMVRSLAEHYDPDFTFISVLNPDLFLFERFATQTALDAREKRLRDTIFKAKQRFETVRRELPEVQASFECVVGNPQLGIIERARETKADLVLMGTHGWTGLKYVLLGSVAEKIVRNAPCPVLTVRPPRPQSK